MQAVDRLVEVEAELRSLCEASVKRAPDVKKTAEVAILKIRSVHELRDENVAMQVIGSELILRPLLLACSTKLADLTLIALSSIQKIITIRAFADNLISQIVGTLRIQAEIKNELLQVKILQTLSMLPTPTMLEFSDDPLIQAVNICLKLYADESPTIHHTAHATLRSVVSLFFDRAATAIQQKVEFNNEESKVSQNCSAIQSALAVLADFGGLLSGERVQVFSTNQSVTNQLSAEILEGILESQAKLFQSDSRFLKIIQESISATVMRLLRTGVTFPLTLRIVRLIVKIVTLYYRQLPKEAELFLSMICRMTEPEFPLWQRVIALEAIKIFTEEEKLMLFVHAEVDSSDPPRKYKIYVNMCNFLGKSVQQGPWDGHNRDAISIIWKFHTHKGRGLDLLQETVPPIFDELYPISLSVQALVNMVNSVAILVEQALGGSLQSRLVPTSTLRSSTLDGINPTILAQMVELAWAPAHSVLTLLIERAVEDAQIHYLLNAYQTCTNTAGSVNLLKSRNEFLKCLCRFALPASFKMSTSAAEYGSSLHIEVPEDKSSWMFSVKNIISMKILFNVAQCLGNSLGSSWLMVLETLESLDQIIDAKRQFARGSSQPILEIKLGSVSKDFNAESALQDDLLLLDFSLNKLFETSIFLEDNAIAHLLYCLGTLSLAALANAATDQLEDGKSVYSTASAMDLSTAPFSLVKFVRTVECNLYRITRIWEFTVGHLNCIINHKVLHLRAYGVQSLSRLTKLALTNMNESAPKSFSTPTLGLLEVDNGEPAAFPISETPASLEPGVYQIFILNSYRELYKSRYMDSKKAIMSSVYDLMQSCGPILTDGWSTMLQILQDINSSDQSAELVSIGFKTLQLVANDFLDVLPISFYPKLFETLGTYGSQRQVNNISLTSINLLWQICDHIARSKRTLESPHEDKGDSWRDLIDQERSSNIRSSQIADGLELIIFCELKKLSFDLRSEVRNSAVQTCFSTIAAYGDILSKVFWEACCSQVIFPLLNELCSEETEMKDSSVASSATSGTEKQKEFIPVIHHGRDTAEKQWNETKVHVLQGSSRIFRQFFLVLQVLDGFSSYWNTYLKILEKCMINPSEEIAFCAISSLQEVLRSPPAVRALTESRPLLDVALNVYKNVVNFAMNNYKKIEFTNYTFLLESVSQLLQGDGKSPAGYLFTSEDVSMFLELADCLTSFFSDDDSSPLKKNMKETSLQRATLQLIDRLTFVTGPVNLWAKVVCQVVKYVRGAIPVKYRFWKSHSSSKTEHKTQISEEFSQSLSSSVLLAFAQRAIPVLVTLYSQKCPPKVRGSLFLFEEVVSAFADIMTCPTIPKSSDLCTEAVNALLLTIPCGLDSMNNHKTEIVDDDISKMWFTLTDSLREFIFVATISEDGKSDDLKKQRNHKLNVINAISIQILPRAELATSQARLGLIRILRDFPSLVRESRESSFGMDNLELVRACINGIFSLCQYNVESEENPSDLKQSNASLTAPVLIEFASTVIRAFVQDERRSGQRPLSYSRQEEVVYILEGLLELRTYPNLKSPIENEEKSNAFLGLSGERKHLLRLFPLLCDCVQIREERIKVLLQALLHVVSKELGVE